MSFAPQAQGTRTATLRIASNDNANSPEQLTISGTGEATVTDIALLAKTLAAIIGDTRGLLIDLLRTDLGRR